MDDALLSRQVVERALVPEPDELLALDDVRRRRPSASTAVPEPTASGFTAAATFAGSVHGVVVQTISASPSRPFSGKRT